jgi:hypothetical protein
MLTLFMLNDNCVYYNGSLLQSSSQHIQTHIEAFETLSQFFAASLSLYPPSEESRMVRRTKESALPVDEHPGGGHIIVTAQQSRYALDALDAPASKEVS